jgi:acyl carrier protein phosphodiesterase
MRYTIMLESYQELEDLKHDLEARLQDFYWEVKEKASETD